MGEKRDKWKKKKFTPNNWNIVLELNIHTWKKSELKVITWLNCLIWASLNEGIFFHQFLIYFQIKAPIVVSAFSRLPKIWLSVKAAKKSQSPNRTNQHCHFTVATLWGISPNEEWVLEGGDSDEAVAHESPPWKEASCWVVYKVRFLKVNYEIGYKT